MAKANNIDLEVVDVDIQNISAEHRSASGLGKVPAFVGADGYTLSECIAIAIYSTFESYFHLPLRWAPVSKMMNEFFKFSYPCLNILC